MREQHPIVPVLLVAFLALALSLSGPAAAEEPPFDEAELFFELNDTDGDLGIHGKIDGGPWKTLIIETDDDDVLLGIRLGNELRLQGLTELFFESAEPTFDELPPEEFFERFPEGIYDVEGLTLEETELESEVELSHVMPAPAGNIMVNEEPAAEDCDSVLPVVSDPVVIRWDPVTESHPEIGAEGEIEVDLYQFVVEGEDVEFSVELPPDVTEFQVPSEILVLESELKFEILVREATHNQTGVESCFIVE